MVKKSDQGGDETASNPSDQDLAATIRQSAQQIWLAGLGAFSKAQEEGSKVFEALVKEGTTLQKKTREATEGRFGEASAKMSTLASEMTARAGQQWDKLESIFEDRVSRAMSRLGVPSVKDMESLNKRIDALTAKVAAMSKSTAARKTAPRKTSIHRGPRKEEQAD